MWSRAVAELPVHDVVLDGEATGHWGKSGETGYHVFDILWLDGRDVTSLPLEERRALLERLPLQPPLLRVAALDDPKPWERACARRLGRGDRQAPRLDLRASPLAALAEDEVRAGAGAGGRRLHRSAGARVGLGALLVGYYDGDELVFAGKIGTGFDTKLLLELRARLDALEIENTPFTKAVGLPRLRAHWVRPEIVVQVGFIEWTGNNKLRHPRLLGVRIDKPAREVVRET